MGIVVCSSPYLSPKAIETPANNAPGTANLSTEIRAYVSSELFGFNRHLVRHGPLCGFRVVLCR